MRCVTERAGLQPARVTDPKKDRALRQEVLIHARQNRVDIPIRQVGASTAPALDVLKKSASEMINSCTREATSGMSALDVAQTMARATGKLIRLMERLQGVNATIGDLISRTGRALNQHVDATTQFAGNPMQGIEKIKQMFDRPSRRWTRWTAAAASHVRDGGRTTRRCASSWRGPTTPVPPAGRRWSGRSSKAPRRCSCLGLEVGAVQKMGRDQALQHLQHRPPEDVIHRCAAVWDLRRAAE